MLNITLKPKRPLVGLVVAAGLLVAAGGASASPSAPVIAPPQPNSAIWMHVGGYEGVVASRTAGPAAGNPDRATEEPTEERYGSYF